MQARERHGMTKAIHERIFIAGNVLSSKTRFALGGVRYGNVWPRADL